MSVQNSYGQITNKEGCRQTCEAWNKSPLK